ncbi:unnamed protein product [Allacma fusca]|uniref:Uncharacterized protein n=1 Tax=Allacma fusca TaxID=39272 RepID=A0A8J2NMC5_9HEXA|nr:unnamed protein product [Allacma fusca]
MTSEVKGLLMAQYKCTPTTKLRKDREFLGPYADQFLFSDAKQPTQPVVFKSSSQQNNQVNNKRLPDKNFSAFHKKQGVGALQGVEGRREARAQIDKNRQKSRRTELMMNKRGIVNDPVVSMVQKSGVGSTTSLNLNSQADSRREQLQRWKLQKEKAVEAANRKLKPQQVHPVTKIVNAPAPPGERRVTRAMSKATVPGQTSMQPAISKMKNLTLNPKLKKAVSFETLAPTKPKEVAITTRGRKTEDLCPVHSYEGVVQLTTHPEIKSDATAVEQVPPPAAPPKKKIMGLDRVYMDYNLKLVEACTFLMNQSDHWRAKLDNDTEIPDDVVSDIESVLGAAKLLMDSKLPQFVQLLYYYLSKETNPGPVLPCDLQGWWDVASIQIEKVKVRFTELTGIEQNGWRPICPPPEVKQVKTSKPMQNSTYNSSETGQAVKPKPKPQASSGLLAFLANKRRNAATVAENEPSAEHVPSSVTEKVNKLPSPPLSASNVSPTREFQGGFFQISSPLRSSNKSSTVCSPRPSVHSVRAHSKTPLQRRVSAGSNASLITLAVRKSMGPFCKIGAASPELVSCPQDEIQNMPRREETKPISIQDQHEYSLSYIECVDHDRNEEVFQSSKVLPVQSEFFLEQPVCESDNNSQVSMNISQNHYMLSTVSPATGIDYDSEMEFRIIDHNLHYDHRRDVNSTSSSSELHGRTEEEVEDEIPNQFRLQMIDSKCNFSRSFHHFMDTVLIDDRQVRKVNTNKAKSRRRKSETVKFKWKTNSKNWEALKIRNDYSLPPNNPHLEHTAKVKRYPGVIGDGRYKCREASDRPTDNDTISKHSPCHCCNLHNSLDNGYCTCRLSSFYGSGSLSSLETESKEENCINVAVGNLENKIFGDHVPILQEPVEELYWSPFCYRELGLFDNQQLRSALSSVYPDWPRDLVLMTEQDLYNKPQSSKINSNECDYRTKYISYSKGDVSPDPTSYCEIFGAQNLLDCNPEYSPFHDAPVSLVDSLIVQQQQKPKSSWPIHRSNCDRQHHLYHPHLYNHLNRTASKSKTGRGNNCKQGKRFASGRTTQVPWLGEESESISSDHSTSASTFQCDICDIYRIIRKKANKFPCSSDSVNVSAQCTNCGRFTDVTPRRSTRMSVVQNSVPRSMGGHMSRHDSASD